MRILSVIAAAAMAFAKDEVDKATPVVQKAVSEISGDLKQSNPIAAFGQTITAAATELKGKFGGDLSWTGIFGAAASAFMKEL